MPEQPKKTTKPGTEASSSAPKGDQRPELKSKNSSGWNWPRLGPSTEKQKKTSRPTSGRASPEGSKTPDKVAATPAAMASKNNLPEVKEETEADGRKVTSSSDGSHNTVKHNSVGAKDDASASKDAGTHANVDAATGKPVDRRSSSSSSSIFSAKRRDEGRGTDDKTIDTAASVGTSLSEAQRTLEKGAQPRDKGMSPALM